MLRKYCFVLVAVLLAFSLVTCNNYDAVLNPVQGETTAVDYDAFTAWTTANVGGPFTGSAMDNELPEWLIRSGGSGDPSITISAGKINVAGRTNGYSGLSFPFDILPPGVTSLSVKVKGKVVTASGNFQLTMPQPPYGEHLSEAVAAGADFEFEKEIPVSPSQPSFTIRQLNANGEFDITGLEVKYIVPADPFDGPSFPKSFF
jgi:hypothetical protein